MTNKVIVNGRFLSRRLTGVDRVAIEVTKRLRDKLSVDMVIALPKNADIKRVPEGVSYEVIGSNTGTLWEQIDLPHYNREQNGLLLNLCDTAPIADPGIVCIHDMSYRRNKGFHSGKMVLWHTVMHSAVIPRAKGIITVSEFSKREIEHYYPKHRKEIKVMPCGWQHLEGVTSDDGILKKQGLEKDGYFFAMSTLTPNKNLRWIAETAKINRDLRFVVAGGKAKSNIHARTEEYAAENLEYFGYITDEQAKALLENCRAFLFPTFYEGFGIPPLEAMACGSVAIVSNNECMREVYGKSVIYIDPNIPQANLGSFIDNQPINRRCIEAVLQKYDWDKSAAICAAVVMDNI